VEKFSSQNLEKVTEALETQDYRRKGENANPSKQLLLIRPEPPQPSITLEQMEKLKKGKVECCAFLIVYGRFLSSSTPTMAIAAIMAIVAATMYRSVGF
jgi:hypothetical protein